MKDAMLFSGSNRLASTASAATTPKAYHYGPTSSPQRPRKGRRRIHARRERRPAFLRRRLQHDLRLSCATATATATAARHPLWSPKPPTLGQSARRRPRRRLNPSASSSTTTPPQRTTWPLMYGAHPKPYSAAYVLASMLCGTPMIYSSMDVEGLRPPRSSTTATSISHKSSPTFTGPSTTPSRLPPTHAAEPSPTIPAPRWCASPARPTAALLVAVNTSGSKQSARMPISLAGETMADSYRRRQHKKCPTCSSSTPTPTSYR